MKKKVKIKTKMEPTVTWKFCGKCGHAIIGLATMSVSALWPDPVKVPKKKGAE